MSFKCLDIVSDGGPQFSCRVGVTASLSSGFHPQSNGQTERVNQELEAILRSLVAENPLSWSSPLPWAKYHTTPFSHPLLGFHHSNASLGTSHPCFQTRRAMLLCLQPCTSSGGAGGPERGCVKRFFVPPNGTRSRPTVKGDLLPTSGWDRGSGCPPGTFLYWWSLVSLLCALLGSSRSFVG